MPTKDRHIADNVLGYLAQVTSQANSNNITHFMTFYEHTPHA